MTIKWYTIGELCELFQMSRQYLHRLIKQGKGPVLSGNRPQPTIKLMDALVFGEDRARATSEAYRDRWEAGIRRVRIDMKLTQLSQDKADATRRAQYRQALLTEYEKELEAWERHKQRNPMSNKPRPPHPFAKRRERSKDGAHYIAPLALPHR